MNVPTDEIIRTIGPCDVVMGRGKSAQRNGGNVEYRKIIQARHEEYCSVPDRRNGIAEEVIRSVKSRGGRFVRQVVLSRHQGEDECWVRCAESVVRTKVKQALRDMSKQSLSLTPPPKTGPLNPGEPIPSNVESQVDSEHLAGIAAHLPRKQGDRIPIDLRFSAERMLHRDKWGLSNSTGIGEPLFSESSYSRNQFPRGFPPFLPENRLSMHRESIPNDQRSGGESTFRGSANCKLEDSEGSTGRFKRLKTRANRKLPGLLLHSSTVMADSVRLPYSSFQTPSTRQQPQNEDGLPDRKLTTEELHLLLGANPSLASRSARVAGVPQAAQLSPEGNFRHITTAQPQISNPSAALHPSRITRSGDNIPAALTHPLNDMQSICLASANTSSHAKPNTGILSTSSSNETHHEDTHVPSVTMSRHDVLQRYFHQEQNPNVPSFLARSELEEVKLELKELEEDEAPKR